MGVRIAHSSVCAACFQQQPEVPHVDYDAAIDRGARIDPASGYPLSTMDDLILCANCVRAGAELLQIDPQAYADMQREIDGLKRDLAKANEYADRLEDTIPRRPGRPRTRVAA